MKWRVRQESSWRKMLYAVVYECPNDAYDQTYLMVRCPNANATNELQLAKVLCEVLNKACAEGTATLRLAIQACGESLVVPKKENSQLELILANLRSNWQESHDYS